MTKKKKMRIAKRLGWIIVAIDQSEDLPMDIYDKIIEFTFDIAHDVGGMSLANIVKDYITDLSEKILKLKGDVNEF